MWKIIFLPLITSIDDDGIALKCINVAHVVRAIGKGYSGMFVTMGLGAMIDVSKKLGLVTTSSTETEIAASGEQIYQICLVSMLQISPGR